MISPKQLKQNDTKENISLADLFWIYLIFFFNYTEGFWTEYVSEYFQYGIELIFVVFLLRNTSKWLQDSCGGKLTCFWLAFSLFLATITWTIVPMLKEIRFFLYYILLFRIFWNESFSLSQIKKLFSFIIFLILLNGVISFIRIFFMGLREERLVGIISSSGGTTATSFPMLICSILALFFLFDIQLTQKASFQVKKYAVMLLLLLSAFLIGYGSGKRAILVLTPLAIFATFIFSSFHLSFKTIAKKTIALIFILLALNTLLLHAFYNTHGYDYVISEGDSWTTVLQGVWEYTNDYEFSQNQGSSMGRLGSTIEIWNACQQDNIWLTGIGYHSHKDEETRDFLNIIYGVCGWSRDMINGGILAVLFSIVIYVRLIFSHKSTDGVWKVLKIVILFNFLCIYFFYSSDYAVSLKLNMLIALLLALANSPNYEQIRQKLFCPQTNIDLTSKTE